jgi:formylglycine-generating enzyme required for sulfatase activity
MFQQTPAKKSFSPLAMVFLLLLTACTTEPLAPISEGIRVALAEQQEGYTSVQEVDLTILSASAEEMLISNRPDFQDAAWQAFASTSSWELAAGDGLKTIYVKTRSLVLEESEVVTAEVTLDTYLEIESFLCVGLGGAAEPFQMGDDLLMTLQMRSSLATGDETGGAGFLLWPGVIDTLHLTDAGAGAYEGQITLQSVFLIASASVGFTDRAENSTQTQVTMPEVELPAMEEPAYPGVLIEVPAGSFTMGQSGVATPEHQVTLTRDFMMGKTEVTNAEYCEVLNFANEQGVLSEASSSTARAHGHELLDVDDNDCEIGWNGNAFFVETVHSGNYQGQPADNHPVREVSWYGAACYCDWLSMMEGLTPYYDGEWNPSASHNPYEHIGYRLPTEAEWEYTARYSDGRRYPWGGTSPNSNLVNYNQNVGWTSPVGTYPDGASTLGCLDMAGNVGELCNDWYTGYSSGAVEDPMGPQSGSSHVARGGDWYSGADILQSASRYNYYPVIYDGFRVLRSPVNP